MTAFSKGCDWIGACKKCGSIFACEMIASSTNTSGIHVHMALGKGRSIHSAVSDAEPSEKP